MGVILTLIAGLVVWIVLWAIGAKSFDAFLITIVMMLVVAAAPFGVAACGDDDDSGGGGGGGGEAASSVTVYSSLPLQGASRPQTTAMVDGIKLALEQTVGKDGDTTVNYKSLDDSTAQA